MCRFVATFGLEGGMCPSPTPRHLHMHMPMPKKLEHGRVMLNPKLSHMSVCHAGTLGHTHTHAHATCARTKMWKEDEVGIGGTSLCRQVGSGARLYGHTDFSLDPSLDLKREAVRNFFSNRGSIQGLRLKQQQLMLVSDFAHRSTQGTFVSGSSSSYLSSIAC